LRPLVPCLWALALGTGCAGAGSLRPAGDPLQEELRALRRQNEELAARVDALSNRLDLLTARVTRGGELARPAPAQPAAAAADAATSTASATPAGLTVIKVSPSSAPAPGARPGRTATKGPRVPAPPIPTTVQIQDPDGSELEALGRPGRKPLAAEADGELRAARALPGLARAHALEDFTSHYPQHASADNALVEAAGAYAEAGNEDAACALAKRTLDEYPAGDAQSDALEMLAGCLSRRGDAAGAQQLLDRLRADFPGTPAAQRAEARLSQAPGRGGAPSREVPARSGP
jgi:TolA-binding protein